MTTLDRFTIAHHIREALEMEGLECRHLATSSDSIPIEVSHARVSEAVKLTLLAAELLIDWTPVPLNPPKPDYNRLYDHVRTIGREAKARLKTEARAMREMGWLDLPWPEDLDRNEWSAAPAEDVPDWVRKRGERSNIVEQGLHSIDGCARSRRLWTSRLYRSEGRQTREWFVQPMPEGFSEKPTARTLEYAS